MRKLDIYIGALTLAILVFLPNMVMADNYMRDYIAPPPGTSAMAVYYMHTNAYEAYSNGDSVGLDSNLEANVGLLRGIHWYELGGFLVNSQLILPFGDLHLGGSDIGAELSGAGTGDPIFIETVWFVNNPDDQTWVAFSPYITMPLGDYDNDKALNLGNNRWAFKGEVGYVKGFGKVFLDLTVNAEFYTDNDDYGAAKVTLEKDALYCFETHVSYNVNDKFVVAGDYYYHNGGETTVNDVDQKDEENDHSLGLTLCYSLNPSYQLLFNTRKDVVVENGFKENTFGVRFFHFF